MAPDAHPQDDGDPAAAFHAQLRDLHLAAGKPSARVLERKTGYGSTTCNDVLRGARFPSWEVTEALVSVLGADALDWRLRWQDARRALDAQQEAPGAAGAPAPRTGATQPAENGGSSLASGTRPPSRSSRSRRAYLALAAVAGGAAVVAVLLVSLLPTLTGRTADPPAMPTCATARRYTVEEPGRLLDAQRREIGEVVPGDQVVATTLDRRPYRSRLKVTVQRTGQQGYVDQAKVRFVETVCRTTS